MADTSTYTVTGAGPLAALNDVQTIGLGPGVIGGNLRIRGNFVGTISFTSDPGSGTYAAQTLTNLSGSNGSSLAGTGLTTVNYLIPSGIVGLKVTMTAWTSGNVSVSWDYSLFNNAGERDNRPSKTTRRQNILMDALGYYHETFVKGSSNAGSLATDGQVYFMLTGFTAGDVITNLICNVTAAGTGTSIGKMGVYTSAGVFLGATTDQSTAFNSIGYKPSALTTPVTIPADGAYYLAVFAKTATTMPTFLRSFTGLPASGQIGSNPFTAGIQGGVTDLTGNATITNTGSQGNFYWIGVS